MKLIVQMHACQFGRLGQACEGRAKRRIFAIGNSTGLSFPTCQPTRGCYVTCGKHYTPLLSQTLHSALPPSVLLALAHEQQLLRDLATAERLTLPAAKLLLIHSFPIPPLTIDTQKVVSLGKNRDEVRPLAQSISTNVVVVLQSQTVFSGKTGFLALGTSALGILLYLLALRCHQLFPGKSGQYVGYGKASYSRSLSIDKKEWSFISSLHTSSIIPLRAPTERGAVFSLQWG